MASRLMRVMVSAEYICTIDERKCLMLEVAERLMRVVNGDKETAPVALRISSEALDDTIRPEDLPDPIECMMAKNTAKMG